MRRVLQRLLENRLYVKAEKCKFHSPSVTFLGYILAGGQVNTDPVKVLTFTGSVFEEWPTPASQKDLQTFFGFAKFDRRFIWNYNQVAAALTHLM